MGATIELTLLKILVVVAVVAGLCGATWFAASAHYSKLYAGLQAEIKQAAADEAKDNAATTTRYAQAAMEVNDEAQTSVAFFSDAVKRLQQRPPTTITRQVPAAAPSTIKSDERPNGPAAPASDHPVPGFGGSTTICLDSETLGSVLATGTGAMNEVLFFRKWAREVGAAK